MMRDGPIRALIIDDLVVFRQMLLTALGGYRDLHALGCGGQLEELRTRLLRFHPEVIVLDLDLRSSDAFELLGKLRTYHPVPLIVAAHGNAQGAPRAIRAIEAGALEVVRKPDQHSRSALETYARELAQKIRAAVAQVRPLMQTIHGARPGMSLRGAGVDPSRYLVAVGASTGGTQAITALLEHVPADFPALVIVQHMPSGFTKSFAERLNGLSVVRVTEAEDGDVLGVGQAVIARGDTHLEIAGGRGPWHLRYTHQQPVNHHCPSVDVLFESLVSVGRRAVGVLLTGMGADGARGLLKLRQAGALTIAQDKASSVVYGMPMEAVRLRAVMHAAPPERIPALVVRSLARRGRGREASAIRHQRQ